VNELGQALALLLDAHSRSSSVRAVIRAAFTPMPDVEEGESDVGPEEDLLRIWLAPPDRMRLESDEEPGPRVGIRDGANWWIVEHDGSTYSNASEPEVGTDLGDSINLTFDPAPLVGALKLEVIGRSTVAGRQAVRLRGTPRPHANPEPARLELEELHSSDEFEFDVDAERGVLLRRSARHRGHERMLQEVLEIHFDEEFEPDTFKA
jgi:outer membrane lipoprotein-sorting protein